MPNIAIIITDGVATREIRREVDEARQLKAEGVYSIAIGITGGLCIIGFYSIAIGIGWVMQ